MTRHTDGERSDEDDGKYSTDAALTFDNLLQGRKNDSDAPATLGSPAHDPTMDSPDIPTSVPTSHTNETSETTSGEADALREAAAEAVAATHINRGPDETYLVTQAETGGEETTYSFHRTCPDENPYYYLLQKTRQPEIPVTETWAILDVGTDWDYVIPELDHERLQDAIRTARNRDWQDGATESVDYLTADQIDAIQHTYRSLVETRVDGLTESPTSDEHARVRLFGEYTVVDVNEVVFDARLRDQLSARQISVVAETLVSAALADLDTANWWRRDVSLDRIDCPLVTRLEFQWG